MGFRSLRDDDNDEDDDDDDDDNDNNDHSQFCIYVVRDGLSLFTMNPQLW